MSNLWLTVTMVGLTVGGLLCFLTGQRFSKKSAYDWTKLAQTGIVNATSLAFGAAVWLTKTRVY